MISIQELVGSFNGPVFDVWAITCNTVPRLIDPKLPYRCRWYPRQTRKQWARFVRKLCKRELGRHDRWTLQARKTLRKPVTYDKAYFFLDGQLLTDTTEMQRDIA